MKHLLIPSLSDLIQPGIFGIIHNRNIYIGYSNNMLQAVSRQLTSIQDKVNVHFSSDTPINELQVVIIETLVDTPHLLKIRQTYWVDDYILQGYQVVNTNRLLRYHTRIRVDANYNVLVELVPRNKKSIIVGVFSKVSEAQAYSDFLNLSDPIIPLIADNDLTKQYLQANDLRKYFGIK